MLIEYLQQTNSRRRELSRGRNDGRRWPTLSIIPSSRTMARQLQTVAVLDGDGDEDLGAVGGGDPGGVESASASNESIIPTSCENGQTQLQPLALRRKIDQTLVIDALVTYISKTQYSEAEDQKKLYGIICTFLRESKLFPGWDGDRAIALRAHFQDAIEMVLENAKTIVQNPDNINLIVQNSVVIVNRNDANCDWRSYANCNLYIFNKPRYSTIFRDIKKIAKGGGGVVYQAKNIVDECMSAIKIIPIKLHDVERNMDRILDEAIVLAKLNHPNIVSYKTAWIDHCSDPDCLSSPESSPATNTNDQSSAVEASANAVDDTESSSVVFEKSHSSKACLPDAKSTSDNRRIFRRSVSCDERQKENAVAVYRSNKSKQDRIMCRGQGDQLFPPPNSRNQALTITSHAVCQTVLVIQMELCSYTLREWMDKRRDGITGNDVFSAVDEYDIQEKLESILSGVEYIHDVKNLIHRDLKPSNIFFDDNHQVKIGDFGLAASDVTDERRINGDNLHTSRVGTQPYVAPEQLNSRKYDSKADMYSLGLIIFEMYHPFMSGTERAICFEQAKNMNLPKEFHERFPREASLIKSLLCVDPKQRPSAKDVLCSGLLTKGDRYNVPKIEITSCCDGNVDADIPLKERIQALEKENQALKDFHVKNDYIKDIEIKELREQIRRLQKEMAEMKKNSEADVK